VSADGLHVSSIFLAAAIFLVLVVSLLWIVVVFYGGVACLVPFVICNFFCLFCTSSAV
jgi:hypothetical protein